MDMQESARMQVLLLETVEVQKQLLAQANILIERQRQENAHLRQQSAQAAAALQQAAQRLETGGTRLGQDALQVIGAQGRRVLTESTRETLGELNQQVERTTEKLTWAEKVAGEQSLQLSRVQTTLVWKSLLVLGLGSLLLAGSSVYVAWDRMRVVKQADFGQDILQATRTGAISRCGDALCVRVGKNPERYSSEYVLLRAE